MKAKQVVDELKKLTDSKRAKHSKRFFKTAPGEYGEGDEFLGVKVPQQRNVAKKYKALPTDEVGTLLQHSYHEVRLTGVFLLVYKAEKGDENTLKEVVDCYLDNLSGINNWDLVDSSCHQILGRWLQDKDRQLLYDFARSDDLWKKRIAMITLLSLHQAKRF